MEPESSDGAARGRKDRLRRRAATASLAVALSLALLKILAAVASGSLAVLASLIDSLTDVVASAITFLSVRISQQPPDRAHRFGHGKAEALSALAQAALVAGAALFIVVDAARRLGWREPMEDPSWAVATMLVATAATLALVAFQRYVVRVTGSPAIAGDSMHYKADLVTNIAVLGALVGARRPGLQWLDPVTAVVVSLFIASQAARIGRVAVRTLMDHELPREQRERIADIVNAHPAVRGLHDLRTRDSGTTTFVELHVELDPAMRLAEAHDVTDELERRLFAAFPDAEVIIHQEPAGLDDHRLDHVIAGARPGTT